MPHFNSNEFAPKERIEAWSDFASRNLASFRVRPMGREAFRLTADVKPVGEITMMRLVGSGHHSERSAYEIAQQKSHFYAAVVQVHGPAELRTCRGSAQISSGDVTFLGTMEKFAVGLELPYDNIVLRLPDHWAKTHLRRPDLICGSVMTGKYPLSSVLTQYVDSVYRRADQFSVVAQAAISKHVLELLLEMLACEATSVHCSLPLRAATFDRACQLIRLRCSDPNLKPWNIAKALGISLRGLQRIFSEQGDSLMQRVSRERIELAAEMLLSRKTVTEVAFESGFSDLTTFERVFVAAKGVTPSQWRKESTSRSLPLADFDLEARGR